MSIVKTILYLEVGDYKHFCCAVIQNRSWFSPCGVSDISYHLNTLKRKSLNDSNNYRGIALGSILGKLLNILILNSNKQVFSSSHLQLAFKEHSLTTKSTLLRNKVIQHYLKK